MNMEYPNLAESNDLFLPFLEKDSICVDIKHTSMSMYDVL